jgi:hypothetical protein
VSAKSTAAGDVGAPAGSSESGLSQQLMVKSIFSTLQQLQVSYSGLAKSEDLLGLAKAKDVEDLKSNVEGLKADLALVKGELAALKASSGELQDSIDYLRSTAPTFKALLDSLPAGQSRGTRRAVATRHSVSGAQMRWIN